VKELSRLERISRIVDREIAALEATIETPESRLSEADLGRLETLAKMLRHLEIGESKEDINPFEGLPEELLQQVLKHSKKAKE